MKKQQIAQQCNRQVRMLMKKYFGNLLNDALLRRPEMLTDDYSIDLPQRIEQEYREFLADLWSHVQIDDPRPFEQIMDKQYVRMSLDSDYREKLQTAYTNAKHISYWEKLTHTNYRDVNHYKGLLRDYVEAVLRCMTDDFLEDIKEGIVPTSYVKDIHYDVFISCNSMDYLMAKEVYEFLTEQGYNAFFAETSISEAGDTVYKKTIDSALDNATHFVLVTTDIAHLESKWVDYEINMFQNEKLSGRKTGNIVTIAEPSITVGQLPISLRVYQVLPLTTYKHSLCKFLWKS